MVEAFQVRYYKGHEHAGGGVDENPWRDRLSLFSDTEDKLVTRDVVEAARAEGEGERMLPL